MLNENFVFNLKQVLANENKINVIKYIFNSHIKENYYFFYINIIPSFFGLYYLTIGKILNLTSVLGLIGVIILTIYIVFIVIKNLNKIKNDQKIIANIIFFIFLSSIVIINGNFWVNIKLYFYLFPFIFIFIVSTNFNSFKII